MFFKYVRQKVHANVIDFHVALDASDEQRSQAWPPSLAQADAGALWMAGHGVFSFKRTIAT
jgi:hypothetical protein